MTICDNCGCDGAEQVKPLRKGMTEYEMKLCGICLIDFRNWNKRWETQFYIGRRKFK